MTYDAVIIGGGLSGATLGKELASAGHEVLIIEKEAQFRDRIRGEQMHPWGIAEARKLGIYDLLKQSCAHEVRFTDLRIAGAPPAPPRDLVATTPHRAGSLHFLHSEMQRVLLGAAEDAGADVMTGASVETIRQDEGPITSVTDGAGRHHSIRARLVVGADGRSSRLRQLGGFTTRKDPDRMVVAGVLISGMAAPDDRVLLFEDLGAALVCVVVPLGNGHHRVYVCYRKGVSDPPRPLSGKQAFSDFAAASIAAGCPVDWYEDAAPVGPLASFNAADTWVEHPHQHGIVLIGDAAASNDPSYGCGLSMTLRSVRLLRDHLLAEDDWRTAAETYAAAQFRDAAAMRRLTGWLTDLCFDQGSEADKRRANAFGRLADDPTRLPDIVGVGPEAPSDERARQRLFGEV